jgi:hypothetical protein
MAVITTNTRTAQVEAVGEAMDVTVNFNGTLIDMLSTVYVYILMSAIREAIQNACDAARRSGLSFSEGVLVQLPTPSNPMITIIDKGEGMTQEFMNTTYLSMGSSTKAGDNGSAGGLGVGRWAAYGYIRECYITTCHASEMVEHTYFQYQGPDAKAKVQPAGTTPGTVAGTKVNFPVKETDIVEALRAVAWLKEVMQLTMGDSFSVDTPPALPSMLPEFNGTVIDLETVDEGLKGVLVYPMMGNNLKYGRQGVQQGSLVVLTNKEAGVGGLPFHVQSPAGDESVFKDGMIVEIPLSFGVPFMPSREELKYTDEVTELLKRIDAAAAKAIVVKARELFMSPVFRTKGQLSRLLGNTETWHWFARGTRAEGVLQEPLKEATGNDIWRGLMKIPYVPEMSTITVKSTSTSDPTLREGYSMNRFLALKDGKEYPRVTFLPNHPVALVVNDMKTGGTVRFRGWLRAFDGKQQFVYLTADDPADALKASDALNAAFGGALEVFRTSAMPTVARVVVGKTVVASRSRASQLTFYSRSESKQDTATMGFATYSSAEPVRVWLGKDGGAIDGFKAGVFLADLSERWGEGNLASILGALRVDRLYLLTPKQQADLTKAQVSVQEDGLWDMADDEFADDEDGQETLRAIKALKSWKTFEEALSELLERSDVQALLAGKRVRAVKENWEFNQFCEALSRRPRMELTGTTFDKAMAQYVDLLSGELKIHSAASLSGEFQKLCSALGLVGKNLEEQPTDSDSRKEMIATLNRVNELGMVDYGVVYEDLKGKYPLLLALGKLNAVPAQTVDDMCRALAAIYR